MRQRINIFSHLLLGCTLAICCSSNVADAQDFSCTPVLNDGEPVVGVMTLLQDQTGLLWIGTQLGLFTYDSRALTRIQPSPGTDPYVQSLLEDQAGHIWVGTQQGVSRFDPYTGTHSTFGGAQLTHPSVLALAQTREGMLYVGTQRGLDRFDPANQTFSSVAFHSGPQAIPDSGKVRIIRALMEDTGGRLWVGTRSGLYWLDDREAPPLLRPSPDSALRHLDIATLSLDAGGTLWIGTWENGLYQKSSTGSRKAPALPPDETIPVVLMTTPETGWAGTWDQGLLQINGSTVRSFSHQPEISGSLPHNKVTTLLLDAENRLWVGTWRGLCRQDAPPWYKTVGANTDDRIRFGHAEVTDVYVDPQQPDVVWVATLGGGLNRWDRRLQTLNTYRHDPLEPTSLSYDELSALAPGTGPVLWVTTYQGLNAFDRTTGRATRVLHDPDDPTSLSHNVLYSVLQDRQDRLWVGTANSGLNLRRQGHAGFTRYQSQEGKISYDAVWPLMEDEGGTLWAGTMGGGLNQIQDSAPPITYQHLPNDTTSLSDDRVISLYRDARNRLWVGTLEGGLNRLDPGSEAFVRYDLRHNLPDMTVTCMIEDKQGRLWAGTAGGLAQWIPEQNRFMQFSIAHGFASVQFNPGACAQSPQDELLFGSARGLVIIDPAHAPQPKQAPRLLLTQLMINDQSARLDSAVTFARAVRLTHTQNRIRFGFQALAYDNPDAVRYAYRMHGIDQQWYETGETRSPTYAGLQPGRYRFDVKSTNAFGLWTSEEASIGITITPPWWQTWWARGLGLFFLIVFVLTIHRILVRQAVGFERDRQRIADDLHDDLTSSMSAIVMRLRRLSRAPGLAANMKAGLLESADLVRQVNAEVRNNIWLIDTEQEGLHHLVDRMETVAKSFADRTEVLLEISHPVPEIRLDMHKRRDVFMVFKEALHNAIRHAEAHTIWVTIAAGREHLTFSIRDNGKGFAPNQVRARRGMMTMQNRAEQLKAQLDIVSTPGEGTRVHLDVPLP